MEEITVTVTRKFTQEDIVGLIDSALEGGIGYWAVLCNDREEWSDPALKGLTIDVKLYRILKSGKSVFFEDAEDEDEVWELTMNKLIHGIELILEKGEWNGDVFDADSTIGDMIFQYALFDEVIYG